MMLMAIFSKACPLWSLSPPQELTIIAVITRMWGYRGVWIWFLPNLCGNKLKSRNQLEATCKVQQNLHFPSSAR